MNEIPIPEDLRASHWNWDKEINDSMAQALARTRYIRSGKAQALGVLVNCVTFFRQHSKATYRTGEFGFAESWYIHKDYFSRRFL